MCNAWMQWRCQEWSAGPPGYCTGYNQFFTTQALVPLCGEHQNNQINNNTIDFNIYYYYFLGWGQITLFLGRSPAAKINPIYTALLKFIFIIIMRDIVFCHIMGVDLLLTYTKSSFLPPMTLQCAVQSSSKETTKHTGGNTCTWKSSVKLKKCTI